MTRCTPELRKFLAEKTEALEWSWNQKCETIREEVKERFGYVLESGEQLRLLIKNLARVTQKTKEISDAIPAKPPYTVSDGHYLFETKNGILKLSCEDADEIFSDFSKHGGNYTGEKMRQKYGLTPQAWQVIKGRLGLYKDSHVVSPATLEGMDEEEKEERIVEVIDRHWADRVVGKMVATNEKKFKREAERAMRFLYDSEYRLGHLKTFLENYRPELPNIEPKKIENDDIVHFFLSDIHLGKKGTDKIKERLELLCADIVASPERVVYLTIGGDIGESFAQGGMHPGQLEYGHDHTFGFGFDALMKSVEIFQAFILKLYEAGKELHVTGLLGNHGRFTQKNEDDKKRTAELVIYEMIRRGIEKYGIELNTVKEKIGTIDYGSVRFIVAHGDGNFDKQRPEYVLNTHGDRNRYAVVVSGDKHNFQSKEGFNYTWVKVPALAGAGEYDTDLNLHAEPWYIVFKENAFGTVDMTLKRLPK